MCAHVCVGVCGALEHGGQRLKLNDVVTRDLNRCGREEGIKVIRHAGVDSGMIILNDQARQQLTLNFQFSLQCNVSPITGLVRYTAVWVLFGWEL